MTSKWFSGIPGIRLITVGDVHLSDVPPVGRMDDYPLSILAKIMEVIDLATKHDAYVIFVGDIFHRRRFNDYTLISGLIKLLKEARCYAIYGNHDWDSRSQSIKGQPINVLYSSGALKSLNSINYTLETDDVVLDIRGLGYQRKLDLKAIEEMQWVPQGVKKQYRAMVLHYMVLPTGTSFYGDYVTVEQIKTPADYVYIGHPHWDMGAYRCGHTTFVNYGALARLYSSEAERDVKVALTYFGPEESELTEHPLKSVLQPERVFARKVEMVKDSPKPMLIESLVSAVNNSKPVTLENLNVPEELKEIVEHYLVMAKQEKS